MGRKVKKLEEFSEQKSKNEKMIKDLRQGRGIGRWVEFMKQKDETQIKNLQFHLSRIAWGI